MRAHTQRGRHIGLQSAHSRQTCTCVSSPTGGEEYATAASPAHHLVPKLLGANADAVARHAVCTSPSHRQHAVRARALAAVEAASRNSSDAAASVHVGRGARCHAGVRTRAQCPLQHRIRCAAQLHTPATSAMRMAPGISIFRPRSHEKKIPPRSVTRITRNYGPTCWNSLSMFIHFTLEFHIKMSFSFPPVVLIPLDSALSRASSREGGQGQRRRAARESARTEA